MKNIILLILPLLLTSQLFAQTYDLQLVPVENAQSPGGNYKAKIQLRKNSGADFQVGHANIRVSFNEAGLSPLGDPFFAEHNFDDGASAAYADITSIGSADSIISLNIFLNPAQSGTPTLGNDWTDVATLAFTILDTLESSRLHFRTAFPNTVIFEDDQITLLDQGVFTGLDEILRPVYPCTGTPEAGTTEAGNNPVCAGESVNLSLFGVSLQSGLSYQWLSSSDGSVYLPVGGATDSILTTPLSTDTYFKCAVTCTASGFFDESSPLLVTLKPFNECYCFAGAGSNMGEKIAQVQVNTLSNSSAGTEGYEDFTNLSTTLSRLSAYPFTGVVSNGNPDDEIIVWIDFNMDGDFEDPGEEVFNSPSGAGPHTGNISIPADAALGDTRMRVRLHNTASGPNVSPCGLSALGQVEDYSINISPCVLQNWFADVDGDGFGDFASSLSACSPPTGFVSDNTDCNDANSTVYPGAPEICGNGIDEDCDGTIDESLVIWTGNGDGVFWDDPANWDNQIVPLACNDIIIPENMEVTVPAGYTATGNTLEVATSSSLSITLTANLIIGQ